MAVLSIMVYNYQIHNTELLKLENVWKSSIKILDKNE